MKHEWTNKHPLDAVESALVDASNALNDIRVDHHTRAMTERMNAAIDEALRLVQADIRRDLNPPDPRD